MIIDKAYYVVKGEHRRFGSNNEIPPIGELEIGEKLNYDAIRKFLDKCKNRRIDEGIINDLKNRLALNDPYGFRVYFEYIYAIGPNIESSDLTIYEVSCTRDTFVKIETDDSYIKDQYYYKDIVINRVVHRQYNTYLEYGHENFKVPGEED